MPYSVLVDVPGHPSQRENHATKPEAVHALCDLLAHTIIDLPAADNIVIGGGITATGPDGEHVLLATGILVNPYRGYDISIGVISDPTG